MDTKELIEFLKANLSIKVEKQFAFAKQVGHKIKILLKEEVITEAILWKN